MTQEPSKIPEDLEELRRRFEEFRSMQSVRSRLPESLWAAAAGLARRQWSESNGAGLAAGLHGSEEASGETGPA